MDKIDQKILEILRQDASLTNAALAEKVHLAPSSCLRRVRRLKETGVITKTVAVIDQKALGRPLRAIVEVDMDRHGNKAQEAFWAAVKRETAVTQAYGITGESDAVLILDLRDSDEYVALCDRLFDNDDNVIRFRTFFVMKKHKE